MKLKRFILDVDGVLNDGMLYWGIDNKPFKAFGTFDHDGLKILRNYLDIQFISADEVGWDISYSRIVNHMRFPLTLVKERERYDWVMEQGDRLDTAYMGDGPYDAKILRDVGMGIAPAQAWRTTKQMANFVTPSAAGHGAVFEACLHIMNKMRIKYEF